MTTRGSWSAMSRTAPWPAPAPTASHREPGRASSAAPARPTATSHRPGMQWPHLPAQAHPRRVLLPRQRPRHRHDGHDAPPADQVVVWSARQRLLLRLQQRPLKRQVRVGHLHPRRDLDALSQRRRLPRAACLQHDLTAPASTSRTTAKPCTRNAECKNQCNSFSGACLLGKTGSSALPPIPMATATRRWSAPTAAVATPAAPQADLAASR